MKKLLKILPLAALGLVAYSVVAVLICCVFRQPLMELFFQRKEEWPLMIPVADAVCVIGQLGAMIWLCVCIGNHRLGIWSELLTVGWLGVALPGFCRVLAYVQNMLVGQFMGSEYVIAQSYLSNLWSYATGLNGIAVSLALMVCGLSMADKGLRFRPAVPADNSLPTHPVIDTHVPVPGNETAR